VLKSNNDVLIGSKLEVIGNDLGLVLLDLVIVCAASLEASEVPCGVSATLVVRKGTYK
jgi:hypothetical protein